MDFFLSGVISFPIGFCEMIKAIYQDCRKRFKMCLSSGFLLLGLSLFSPFAIYSIGSFVSKGLQQPNLPSFSRECPPSLSSITYLATAVHSNQALFQLVWPGQTNKSSPNLTVYSPLKGTPLGEHILTWHRASPAMSLLTPEICRNMDKDQDQGSNCSS